MWRIVGTILLGALRCQAEAPPLLISHRGNLDGARPELENRPDYLLKAARLGFDIEIDVWYLGDGKWMLGHDAPQYAVPYSFLTGPRVWVHAKNGEALRELIRDPQVHVFFHDRDDYTLTSQGVIWIYPDKPVLGSNSIAVMFTDPLEALAQRQVRGACADNVLTLRNKLVERGVYAAPSIPVALGTAQEIVELLVFDLDGVLVETRDLHYNALNKALAEVGDKFVIGYDDHIADFNGLSTMQKLKMLSDQRGLDASQHDAINKRKQQHTVDLLEDVHESAELIKVFRHFKDQGFAIAVASNCVRDSVRLIVTRLGLMAFVDTFLSNQDVAHAKPAPDIYTKMFELYSLKPLQVLIIEDSPKGKQAALLSGAHTVFVDVPEETTIAHIGDGLARARRRVEGGVVNLVVPMAGEGSRFRKAGYTVPKPLIDVRGKHMIEWVIENLRPSKAGAEFRFVFIVRSAHRTEYDLDRVLTRAVKYAPIQIVEVEKLTEGAACTVLLAKSLIDYEKDAMLVANADQWIEWGPGLTVDHFLDCQADGCISTFWANDTKWSFARVDKGTGLVTDVAEKEVISNHATTGIYFWKNGADFVRYAEQMIQNDVRTKGEFYVCPVYNEMIPDGKKVKVWEVGHMWGLGVPADLDFFLANFPQNGGPFAACDGGTCSAS